ncbi:hypothetical protein [Clostridium sp.]|uniref:hypothetical protein n=1 Tax=Clostridium sp. TaxID=1506 RepID=UPI002FC693B5
MGFKSVVLYFIAFTLNLSSVVDVGSINHNSYRGIESEIIKLTEFRENGVKAQYNIKSSLDEEINRIKKLYNKDNIIEETEDKNHFYIVGDTKIEINLWCEDGVVFVEAVALNDNKNFDTVYMKENLQKLQTQNTNSIRYFEYYKGRINSVHSLDEIEIKDGFTKVHNGYVGNTKLKDKSKISYGVMEYDTGVYVIIGTPIIFTTY